MNPAEDPTSPKPDPALRYVVLHHTGFGEPHFDLMLESSDGGSAVLTTFRMPRWPPHAGDIAEQLADHRIAYLSYEGPISGGRGSVRRIAQGAYQILLTSGAAEENRWQLIPDSQGSTLQLVLAAVAPPRWSVREARSSGETCD